MLPLSPLMLGLRGPTLNDEERAFIQTQRPFSFILFARNIVSAQQVQELTAELTKLSSTQVPLIAIDQEGGRVQRLTFQGHLPPAQVYGQWYDIDPATALEMAELHGTLLAAQLRAVGATWVLGPCLDLALPETHGIIGNRALHAAPEVVIDLGRAILKGIRAGGCFSCIKHAPGHGRATADSHQELPTVQDSIDILAHDFAPFAALAPAADFIMTAHIRFPALDAENPATYSAKILQLMQQDWGHKGMILADDLGMHALTGPYVQRAERALAAGCDGVIAALSVVQHGMAGTVFDAANFMALQAATLPSLGPKAQKYLAGLKLPPALTAVEVAEKVARFRALWASRPQGLEALCTV